MSTHVLDLSLNLLPCSERLAATVQGVLGLIVVLGSDD